MSLISSLFGTKNVQFLQNGTAVISIDAAITQTHSRENKPTQYEVEDGNSISDHMILSPFKVKFDGVISDSPLSLAGALLTTAVSAFAPPAGVVAAGAVGSLVSAIMGSKSPSVKAYEQLLKLQEDKEKLTVVTKLKKYDNMFITNISVPREAATGNVLNFTIELQELRIVSPVSVLLQVFKAADLSAGESDLGKQDKNSALVEQFQKGQADFGSLVH